MSTASFPAWSAKAARFRAEADAAAAAGQQAPRATLALSAAVRDARASLARLEDELAGYPHYDDSPQAVWLRQQRDTARAELVAAEGEFRAQSEHAARLSEKHQAARRLAEGATEVVERLRPHYGPGSRTARTN